MDIHIDDDAILSDNATKIRQERKGVHLFKQPLFLFRRRGFIKRMDM